MRTDAHWRAVEHDSRVERDELRAQVERVRAMAKEAGDFGIFDPWDVLDALEGK